MTYKRLLELAANEALRIWGEESKYLEQNPDSLMNKIREHNARDEYEQIRTALIKEEEAMRSRA